MDISTRNRSIIYTLLRRYNGGHGGKGVNYCNMTHGNMAGEFNVREDNIPEKFATLERCISVWDGNKSVFL